MTPARPGAVIRHTTGRRRRHAAPRGGSWFARIGRWCFERRWWVLLAWTLIAVAGALAAGPALDSLSDERFPKHIESVDANDLLTNASGSDGQVIALVDGIDPAAAQVRDAVVRLAKDLAGRTDVHAVRNPYAGPAEQAKLYISADGRALLVVAQLVKGIDAAARNTAVEEITNRMRLLPAELQAAGQQQAQVRVGGNAALQRESRRAVRLDLQRAELLSMPISLVILVVVFGGLAAAGVPIVAALMSVVTAMIALLGFAKVTTLDVNVVTVVTLLGLGLSVDYGLLLVGRYREEQMAGHAAVDAIGRAWATAGRTIAFSALTVAAALSGLLMFNVPGLLALGLAGMSIALVAMLVSLTLVAALLGFGRRRLRPSSQHLRTRRTWVTGNAEAGFFARLSLLVQRRPVLVALATSALLIAAGLPLIAATVKMSSNARVPRTIEAARVFDELGERFRLPQVPAITVVARTEPAQLAAWADRWREDPAVARIRPVEKVDAGVSSVHLDVSGESQSPAAQELVDRIRADRPAGQSWVTGEAAILVDFKDLLLRNLPLALAVTGLAMMALLFAMTGSVVIPIKAILANVISLGATFGVMKAVFEDGWLAGPLDTLTVGGLDPSLLVVVSAFAFALSMDYEVFLLGRIKEFADEGRAGGLPSKSVTDAAVRRGLQHTGRIITSAALLMVVVFSSFAAGRMGTVEQIGVGLSVAVLIDATIVRCLLVPATMTLMGRWNWWAPAPLRRLYERSGLSSATW